MGKMEKKIDGDSLESGEQSLNKQFEATKEVPIAVVEQRVSNLAQGSLCLALLTGPFLRVLGLIPRGNS